MNQDMNHHETCITLPDHSAKIEAIPSPAQSTVVIPAPTDQQGGLLPNGNSSTRYRGKFYEMPLVWRGLHLLGVPLGIAGGWFVIAWVHHGRLPLMQSNTPMGHILDPITPPTWILAVCGLLTLISIGMMLVGTQDVATKLKHGKDNTPNKVSDATSGSAAEPSAHQH